jgi:hypothetical protein
LIIGALQTGCYQHLEWRKAFSMADRIIYPATEYLYPAVAPQGFQQRSSESNAERDTQLGELRQDVPDCVHSEDPSR